MIRNTMWTLWRSKLFGLGSEAYVTGSHEFYTNYVAHKKNCIICLDAGHFHPTEVISSKLSSYLAFDQEIMLHVSRPHEMGQRTM